MAAEGENAAAPRVSLGWIVTGRDDALSRGFQVGTRIPVWTDAVPSVP